MSAVVSAADVRRSRVRLFIVTMLFVVTTVNYADRATLSIAGPALSKELHLDPVAMGYIFSAFGWSYVDRAGAGRLAARPLRLAARLCLQHHRLVAVHDAAGLGRLLQRAATAVTVLFALRFLVGVAEAPSFPANARIVAAWFPEQRARHRVGVLQFRRSISPP